MHSGRVTEPRVLGAGREVLVGGLDGALGRISLIWRRDGRHRLLNLRGGRFR